MKSILKFFRENKAASSLLLSAVLVLAGGFMLSGCNLGSLIRHPVPKAMQSYNDDQPKVSLNDAPFVMDAYLADVNRSVRQFNEDNSAAHLMFDFVNSFTTIGIKELGNAAIPGAGFLSLGLTGIAGLMIRKPGTAREISDEKMASFNKGQDVAMETMKSLVKPAQMKALIDAVRGKSE